MREPASTTAWAKGASGEEQLGSALDALTDKGVIVLHDRQIPGSRANIDHIAIAASGVWVIDAKRYTGQIEKRDVGGWLRADLRLYVGRRDRTAAVHGLGPQIDAVDSVLAGVDVAAPIRPVLCFVGSEAAWGTTIRPFVIDGVLVTWGKALRKRITAGGPLSREAVTHVARVLDSHLRPA